GLLLALLCLVGCAGVANGQSSSFVVLSHPTNTISFSGLTGTNGEAFSMYNEGDFTIRADSGPWSKAFLYGNPVPDIVDGRPNNVTGVATIIITDAADLFTFAGLDYSSNNGSSGYEFIG